MAGSGYVTLTSHLLAIARLTKVTCTDLNILPDFHVFFLLDSSTWSLEEEVLSASSSFVSISGLPSWDSSSVSKAFASSRVDCRTKHGHAIILCTKVCRINIKIKTCTSIPGTCIHYVPVVTSQLPPLNRV